MIKNSLCALLLLCGMFGYGQVVINELDSDTPSTDDKEFIELKSEVANYPLDGYVLVMFNGSATSSTGNRSYFAIDLDGYSTDINGLFVVGNEGVSPIPHKFFPTSTMQNGADAVALYLGNASDFPDLTLATTQNLVDALAYDTNDPDATDLLSLLGISVQTNEDQNNQMTLHSIQRKNDGTYEVKDPTPGAHNDGSGIAFNGILISTPETTLNEGDVLNITFTTETPVSNDLTFNFVLNGSGINAADYTGSTTVLIPAGQTTATKVITIVDDNADEGDELLKIKFGALPPMYNKLNDNLEVRIIDNDYTVAAWGTPLNPTFGIVSSTAPAEYYGTLEGKSGAALKQAIQDIIANPAVVREHTYGDVTDMLYEADQNPLNSNEVWLMYVEQPRAKYKFQTVASSTGLWNREHIYPQSRGGFTDGTSSTPDGFSIWQQTDSNDILAAHSDGHHIRAEDGPENSSRNNRDFGSDYNGPAGNQGSWNGDVARSLFYMAIRYNGLNLVNGNPPDDTPGELGDLATLLIWNHSDPADDFEMNRNNVIYTWQQNRNPFIDHPELADYIWGENAGEPWFSTLSSSGYLISKVTLYPNPVTSQLIIDGLDANGRISIYSMTGALVMDTAVINGQPISIQLSTGIYTAQIKSDGQTIVKKLVIK